MIHMMHVSCVGFRDTMRDRIKKKGKQDIKSCNEWERFFVAKRHTLSYIRVVVLRIFMDSFSHARRKMNEFFVFNDTGSAIINLISVRVNKRLSLDAIWIRDLFIKM